MANIAIVCGYGLVGYEYRTVEEMSGLKIYYEQVNKKVKERNIFSVIFTGGRTNKSFSDLSEAGTASIYWKGCNFQNGYYSATNRKAKIILEQYSKTSEENIYLTMLQLLSGEMVAESGDFIPSKDVIHVFCDEPRYTKMQVICFFFLKLNGVKYEIHPCNRIDTNLRSNGFFQALLATPRMLLDGNFWNMAKELKKATARSW
jgi:hypothetical protein